MSNVQLENPMVRGGDYYDQFPPAAVCPHCGAEWHRERGYLVESSDRYVHAGASSYSPMSDSGQYCMECVMELDSPERREQWADEKASVGVKIAEEYLNCRIPLGLERKACGLMDHLRRWNHAEWMEALQSYLDRDDTAKAMYHEWLMELN